MRGQRRADVPDAEEIARFRGKVRTSADSIRRELEHGGRRTASGASSTAETTRRR
ncbi:hypothetical protein ACWEKR_25750 [Nocardia sp. NPDC004573]